MYALWLIVLCLAALVSSQPRILACTDQEHQYLEAAIVEARRITKQIVDIERGITDQLGLLNATHLRTLRLRYFGEVNEDDDAYIKHVFEKTHYAFNSALFGCGTAGSNYSCEADCELLEPAAAFVKQGLLVEQKVCFCTPFFNVTNYLQPEVMLKMPDERYWRTTAQVVIHEMTHLTKVGRPRWIVDVDLRWPRPPLLADWQAIAYGAQAAQELAYRSPLAAVLDADNYAWYAVAISVGAIVGMPDAQIFDKYPVNGTQPWTETVEYWEGRPEWAKQRERERPMTERERARRDAVCWLAIIAMLIALAVWEKLAG